MHPKNLHRMITNPEHAAQRDFSGGRAASGTDGAETQHDDVEAIAMRREGVISRERDDHQTRNDRFPTE